MTGFNRPLCAGRPNVGPVRERRCRLDSQVLQSRTERHAPGHEDHDPHGEHRAHHGHDHRYGHHASIEEQRRRRPDSEAKPRQPSGRPAAQGYTLGHGGRQVRLGPVTFWIVVGSLVIMAGWSLATGTYFAFHDDVLTRLIARQTEQQFAYEDRIAEMRAQVDRITSRQLARPGAVRAEARPDPCGARRRWSRAPRRSPPCPTRASPARSRRRPAPMIPIRGHGRPKPSPISDTVIFTRAARPRSAARIPRGAAAPAAAIAYRARDRRRHRRHAGAAADLARPRRAAADQQRSTPSRSASTPRPSRIRGVLADLGLDVRKATQRGGRRSVRAADRLRGERQRVRAPALPHQSRPRPGRPADPHARSRCRCASR